MPLSLRPNHSQSQPRSPSPRPHPHHFRKTFWTVHASNYFPPPPPAATADKHAPPPSCTQQAGHGEKRGVASTAAYTPRHAASDFLASTTPRYARCGGRLSAANATTRQPSSSDLVSSLRHDDVRSSEKGEYTSRRSSSGGRSSDTSARSSMSTAST